MRAKYLGAAAAMILLSLPSQAADILNRGFGAPMNQPLSTDRSDIRLGNDIAQSRRPEGGLKLTNDQLDAVAAGLATGANGAAQAEGADVGTKVDVLTTIGQPGPQNALSMGQVTATASGSITAGSATASSALTLTIAVP